MVGKAKGMVDSFCAAKNAGPWKATQGDNRGNDEDHAKTLPERVKETKKACVWEGVIEGDKDGYSPYRLFGGLEEKGEKTSKNHGLEKQMTSKKQGSHKKPGCRFDKKIRSTSVHHGAGGFLRGIPEARR